MIDDGLIRVGLITRTRGTRGELSVKPLTGDPERFRLLGEVFIDKPVLRKISIESVRFHRGQVIVRFEGCGDANAAELYRGSYISIAKDQLVPLGKDSYFVFDLVGCAVYDKRGERLGELVDVLETGSNDVYVVKPDVRRDNGRRSDSEPDAGEVKNAEDILIPALKSVVREVDIGQKRIVVDYDFNAG